MWYFVIGDGFDWVIVVLLVKWLFEVEIKFKIDLELEFYLEVVIDVVLIIIWGELEPFEVLELV